MTGSSLDDGFTLIELLVVMIIIAILAAIGLPTITSQRGRAHDAATRNDARQVGAAVTGVFLESAAAPVVNIAAGRYQVNGADLGPVSPGTEVDAANPALVDTTGWTAAAWCLALTNPAGRLATIRVSAQRGVETGSCASPVAP